MSKKPATEKISFWASHQRFFYYAAALILLALAAQFYSLWCGFTMADYFAVQPLFAVENKKWGQYFMELFANGFLAPFTSPLSKVSIALDFQSGRWWPAAYHASNLLLHIFAVFFAFLFLSRINDVAATSPEKKSRGLVVAFLACAIFALHPALSDTVASLGGRAALLSFVFYMVGLNCFAVGLNAPTVLRALAGYLVAYLCVLFGIFASCQIVTLPLAMAFLGLILKPARESWEGSWKDWLFSRAWELGLVFIMAVGLPFLLLNKVDWPVGTGLGQSAMTSSAYLATQLKALPLYYLRNYFAPFGFTIDPRYAQAQGFSDSLVWLGAVICALVPVLGFVWRTKPFAVFGLFLFIVGFFPAVLLPQPEYASGYRLYLPAFGLSMVLGQFLAPLVFGSALTFKELSRPRLVALALTALSLIGLSAWRDRAYTTNSALLRGALRLDSENYRLRSLLALLLTTDSANLREAADKEAVRALKGNLDLPCAYMARGVWAHQGRDYASSRFCFAEALKLAEAQKLSDEIVLTAKYGLAMAYADANDFSDPKKVEDLARSAMTLYPAKPRLYLALGKALMNEGKPESAEAACREFDKGRRFDRNEPDFAVPNAMAALRTGYPIRFEQAYGAAKTINKIARSSQTELLLGRACLETGRIRRGVVVMRDYFSHTINPTAEAYLVTAALGKQLGDLASEKLYLAKALKLDAQIQKKERLFLSVKPKPKAEELKDEDAVVQGNTIIERAGNGQLRNSLPLPGAGSQGEGVKDIDANLGSDMDRREIK